MKNVVAWIGVILIGAGIFMAFYTFEPRLGALLFLVGFGILFFAGRMDGGSGGEPPPTGIDRSRTHDRRAK